MNKDQFNQTLHKIGLNQSSFARFAGISGRTSRRYSSGDAVIPQAIGMLISVMEDRYITPDEVLALNHKEPN